MGNELLVVGIDFICAALTLAYIARLLCQGVPMHGGMVISMQRGIQAAHGVAKVSLRGQQIARRLR